MPAFTSFLNLYKPGGGSTGLVTPDEVADIDRINANFDLIDDFAEGWGEATDRNHQFYGPAAAKASVTGMKLGDTYQETDGSKLIWKYDGTGWKVQGVASLPPYNSATVAFTGTPFIRGGIASGTTNSGGVLSHSFASAFTTGCAGVLLMPHQNSGYAPGNLPVLVQASVSATGFSTLWPSAPSVSVALPYIAFGY